MIELTNGHIKVLIQEPEEGYLGTRFDRTGKVVQLWWKGIPFCTSELLHDVSGQIGTGFFNEFGMTDPIGYKDCHVGSYFPKIGVGLLQKETNAPYDFFHAYKSKPCEFSEVREENSIIYHCLNKEYDSAFFLEKKITLTEDGFAIDYLLENIGNQNIETSEYVHNFLAPGGNPISSKTKLTFGGKIKDTSFIKGLNPDDIISYEENTIRWKKQPKADFFFEKIAVPQSNQVNWTLINEQLNLGICEIVDFKPSKINLWGRGHVVSPELFKSIKLPPGGMERWKREFKVVDDI